LLSGRWKHCHDKISFFYENGSSSRLKVLKMELVQYL
jgi:hypothetical protein